MPQKSPDYIIILVVVLLFAVSVTMVFSATSISAYAQFNDSFYFFKRQVTWVILGLIVMGVAANVDYHRYLKLSLPAYLVSLVGLILVLIIGTSVHGSKRWIDIGIQVQPSQLAKVAMIMFTAWYVQTWQHNLKKFFSGLLPILVALGIVFILILAEPDLGTAATIAATVVTMLVVGGVRILHLTGIAALGMPLFIYALLAAPYRRQRVFAFLDPWAAPQDAGFHIIQSLYALGSGGLFGVGLGRSKQKFFYLPEPGTDFIFAVLGEELGFIGSFIVLLLYALLALRGMRIAVRAPDLFGSLMAVGITFWIVFQAIINIGVVSGSLPVTGITLPFISYGGSSLVVMSGAVGILLNISRYCER